jgi:AraC-like DNA-binding protein
MRADGSRKLVPVPLAIETIDSSEQRMSFRVGDSWSRTNAFGFRSGVRLVVAACQYEPSFSFDVVQPPAEIELVVSKGAVVLTRTADGRDLERAGTALQLAKVRNVVPLNVRAGGDTTTECVSISMSEAHLRELLGASRLPDAFRDVTESDDEYPLVSRAMTPRLFRALDEIANADVRGPARALWHEAKTLELIALMTDELVDAGETKVSAHEIERLERVRRSLIEHLDAPPTLARLARQAGFNETKLKGKFRALFGTSVFAYLRQVRMEEARRLLSTRQLNVTEVAQRVGYSNPSKFAAAFRRHYGMSPSAI